MADIDTVRTFYAGLFTESDTWLLNGGSRRWNVPDDLQSFDFAAMAGYFDRTGLNAEWEESMDDHGAIHAGLSIENDIVAGLHRSFALRHRGRLQHYRDEAARRLRANGLVENALAEFDAFKSTLS